jgi:hypothetical protein
MSISPPASPKLFAREIAAYNDAQFDRYLEETGRSVLIFAVMLCFSPRILLIPAAESSKLKTPRIFQRSSS